MNQNINNSESKSCWKTVERLLPVGTFVCRVIATLLLATTFLCTAIATTYSVLTASKALEQARIELRPWITIPMIESYAQANEFNSKFQVLNIGKLPAYLRIEAKAFENGKPLKVLDGKVEEIALMPNQLMRYRGLTIKNESYRKLLNSEYDAEIVQEICVYYGTQKGVYEFFTCQKVKLDNKKVPVAFKDRDQPPGIWIIEDSEFK
jgi:hypothetical protein